MLDASPGGITNAVARAEADGYEGGWVIETAHDPFLLLATAAATRTPLHLGTAVAVAFARTPMLLALAGNDLQLATDGKFIMGLGSQVRPHIERRYSMPWEKPVGRMREFVRAVHAIWDSWESGGRLDFRGEYYTHTLMTPMFSPGPNPFGRPPVYLGALGPAMTAVAGEMADGLVVHRLMSERFLRAMASLVPDEMVESFAVLTQSWFAGYNANVAGHDRTRYLLYVGGAPRYRTALEEVSENGYEGFVLS